VRAMSLLQVGWMMILMLTLAVTPLLMLTGQL
jgi:hypothetical protein